MRKGEKDKLFLEGFKSYIKKRNYEKARQEKNIIDDGFNAAFISVQTEYSVIMGILEILKLKDDFLKELQDGNKIYLWSLLEKEVKK